MPDNYFIPEAHGKDMCKDDTRPPYRTVSFSEYLSEIGIHPWVSDIAANSIRYGTPIDRSVADRMSKAFRGFVGGRICAGTVSEAVSRQGYTVSDVGRDCFSVMMNGDVWHICLDILPDKGSAGRTVVLRDGVPSMDGEVSYLPYYAAGMFTCLDPVRRDEFRQRRVEYHWPDTSISGRRRTYRCL